MLFWIWYHLGYTFECDFQFGNAFWMFHVFCQISSKPNHIWVPHWTRFHVFCQFPRSSTTFGVLTGPGSTFFVNFLEAEPHLGSPLGPVPRFLPIFSKPNHIRGSHWTRFHVFFLMRFTLGSGISKLGVGQKQLFLRSRTQISNEQLTLFGQASTKLAQTRARPNANFKRAMDIVWPGFDELGANLCQAAPQPREAVLDPRSLTQLGSS